jgi:hypothetical protein
MDFDKFLEKVKAIKMEDYSSTRYKGNNYISSLRYNSYINNNIIIGKSVESGENYNIMEYIIGGKNNHYFRSFIDLNKYTGRDYYAILNSGIDIRPIIKSNIINFDLSVSIPGDKHIKLTIPKDRCIVSKCNRIEVYPYINEETDWDNLLETYQLFSNGYCYINNDKRSRSYERRYLDGSGICASSFVNRKNMTGELFLDMNPKYISYETGEDTIKAEFKLSYDRSGIIKSIYGLKSTPNKNKTLCKYHVDNDKTITSFHIMLFDPFNFSNFVDNNWNIWVLEKKNSNKKADKYERYLFWLDKDKVFENIDKLEL